jgi:tripartite-type tricarboxylate transporter receptor subunit TctC
MSIKKQGVAQWIVVLAGASMVAAASANEPYPSKPITLIVPYTAGGATDLLARAVGESVSRQLKQPVVIENKPGANGTLGVLQVKKAQPDGYTLTMVPLSVFRQPYLTKVAYDPLKDLSYISTLANYSYAITVRSDAKWKTIKELVDDAKKQPGEITYASTGLYSTNHLAMAELSTATNTKWNHIPFKGDSDALTALMGGHVQVVSATNAVASYVKSGKVRVLATVGDKRSKDFADIPTLKESGYPVVMESPVGVAGPAGLPPAIVEKLDNAFREALKDPVFLAAVAKFNIELNYRDRAKYSDYAKTTAAQEKTIIERLSKEIEK